MNIRVCFAKYDRLRFLGHLDVMRYFQHAIARSGIPIAYSQGFHPHMIMSFAQPLALSMTSDGEYFDCELADDAEVDAEDLCERLQAAMCDGFYIRSVTVLPEREPNTRKQTGMSQIAGAMYLCEPLPGCEKALTDALSVFAGMTSYCIEKKAKNGMRAVDVRAGVHAIGIVKGSCCGADGEEITSENESGDCIEYLADDGVFSVPETLGEGWGREHSEHALHRDGAPRFVFAVDAGSENNISAELIATALRQVAAGELPERCFTLHRMELYRSMDGHMISLSE
ncbi:MAG: TIGR03936 family radical SAM-associated protein [Lachnospiraceae bacterium]|nr:TIGR03936 family radical SAM-associated protein [Lachnospiraceae bacterium]